MNDEEYQRTTKMAVEILTAMFAETRDTDFAMERLQTIVDEHGEQAYKDACAGLINLASVILIDVRENTGTPELDLLKRYALSIERLKPKPPDEPA